MCIYAVMSGKDDVVGVKSYIVHCMSSKTQLGVGGGVGGCYLIL